MNFNLLTKIAVVSLFALSLPAGFAHEKDNEHEHVYVNIKGVEVIDESKGEDAPPAEFYRGYRYYPGGTTYTIRQVPYGGLGNRYQVSW